MVALFCNDFSVNLSVMALDLKITVQMLSALARELGCTVDKQGGILSFISCCSGVTFVLFTLIYFLLQAKLKAPLKLPSRKIGGA